MPWYLGRDLTVWGVILNGLGIQEGWGFRNLLVNNVAWYVSVLLLCYIIFYLIMYINQKKNIPFVYMFLGMIFIGAGIQTYGIDLPFLNESTGRGYCSFFYGLLFAHFFREKVATRRQALISALIILGITIGLFKNISMFTREIAHLFTFVYYPAYVVFFLWKPVQKLFRGKIWGELGEITYDVCMWHFPAFLVMFILLEILPVNVNIYSYKAMIIFTAVMFVVGALSHYLIDKPIQKLLKKKRVLEWEENLIKKIQ